MTDQNLLDKFGRICITEIRDAAIEKYEMIVDGEIRSSSALQLHQKLVAFDDQQLSLIREAVVSSIDNTIHNFLWALERRDDELKLTSMDGNRQADVNESSDGLAGEMYSDDGWIVRYSNYKENY